MGERGEGERQREGKESHWKDRGEREWERVGEREGRGEGGGREGERQSGDE